MVSMTNFKGFDSYLEPILKTSAKRSMHSCLRFVIDYPRRSDWGVPKFLIDGGLKFNKYSVEGGGRSPDYS
eukprot:COSAG05_NODE_7093_length_857_cov_0.667546_1_plen_70_part_10